MYSENSLPENDENASSDFDKISEEISVCSFIVVEEFSEIPKFRKLKEESSIISERLKKKVLEMKQAQMYLSPQELDDFLKLEKFIESIEEKDFGSTDICIDLDYIENLRKQQEIMMRLLKQINALQWEVEQGYEKIKRTEEFEGRKTGLGNHCTLCTPSLEMAKSKMCSCEII